MRNKELEKEPLLTFTGKESEKRKHQQQRKKTSNYKTNTQNGWQIFDIVQLVNIIWRTANKGSFNLNLKI